jgi:hypothetical protein
LFQFFLSLAFSPMRAACIFYPILVDFIILIIHNEEYKLRGSSVDSFLQAFINSALWFPNILLSFLSLCSPFNVKDQVPHPHKTI